MQFGEFIKQQRVKKSIGRSRLGQMVDRSAATIARWERSEAFPVDDEVLVSLGDALGVEVTQLESLLRESRKAALAESAGEESAAAADKERPVVGVLAEEPTDESSPAEPRTGINLAAAGGGVTATEEPPSAEVEITAPEETVVPDAVEAAIFGLTTAEQAAVAIPEEVSDGEDEDQAAEPDLAADPFAPTGESEVAAVPSVIQSLIVEEEAPTIPESDEGESDADRTGVDEIGGDGQIESAAEEESTAVGDEEEPPESTVADDFFGLLAGAGEEEPGPDEAPSGGVAGAAAATAAAIPDEGPDTVETAPPRSARSAVSRGQRRQAPTEVAYDTLGPVSYTESRRQMRTYRIRTVLVVVVMVVLGMLFLWAMAELWEAIGDAWQSF